ncbi:trehalase-like domain-containing protein [Streptomyces olivaceus]
MSPDLSSPPWALREYAVLADGERGAVLDPRGRIVWLCAPRWHDDAVFSALVGGAGHFAVEPADPWHVWGCSYEEGTLIRVSRWVTADCVVECREALALPARPDRLVVLRRMRVVRGGEARPVSTWTPGPVSAAAGCTRPGWRTESGRPGRRSCDCGWPGRRRRSGTRRRDCAAASYCGRAMRTTWCWSWPGSGRRTRWTRTRCGRPRSGSGGRRSRAAPGWPRRATPGTPTRCCAA